MNIFSQKTCSQKMWLVKAATLSFIFLFVFGQVLLNPAVAITPEERTLFNEGLEEAWNSADQARAMRKPGLWESLGSKSPEKLAGQCQKYCDIVEGAAKAALERRGFTNIKVATVSTEDLFGVGKHVFCTVQATPPSGGKPFAVINDPTIQQFFYEGSPEMRALGASERGRRFFGSMNVHNSVELTPENIDTFHNMMSARARGLPDAKGGEFGWGTHNRFEREKLKEGKLKIDSPTVEEVLRSRQIRKWGAEGGCPNAVEPACVEPPPDAVLATRTAITEKFNKIAKDLGYADAEAALRDYNSYFKNGKPIEGKPVPEKLNKFVNGPEGYFYQFNRGAPVEPCLLNPADDTRLTKEMRVSRGQQTALSNQVDELLKRQQGVSAKMREELARLKKLNDFRQARLAELRAANIAARDAALACETAEMVKITKIAAAQQRILIAQTARAASRAIGWKVLGGALRGAGIFIEKLFSYPVLIGYELLNFYTEYSYGVIRYENITTAQSDLYALRQNARDAVTRIQRLWAELLKAIDAEAEQGACGKSSRSFKPSDQILQELYQWVGAYEAHNLAYKMTQFFKFFNEAEEYISQKTLEGIIRGMQYDTVSESFSVIVDIRGFVTSLSGEGPYKEFAFDVTAYPGGQKALKDDLDKIDPGIYSTLFVGSSRYLDEYLEKQWEIAAVRCAPKEPKCVLPPVCNVLPYCQQPPPPPSQPPAATGQSASFCAGTGYPYPGRLAGALLSPDSCVAGGGCGDRGLPGPGLMSPDANFFTILRVKNSDGTFGPFIELCGLFGPNQPRPAECLIDRIQLGTLPANFLDAICANPNNPSMWPQEAQDSARRTQQQIGSTGAPPTPPARQNGVTRSGKPLRFSSGALSPEMLLSGALSPEMLLGKLLIKAFIFK